jgi:hypothetical protein
MEYELKIDKEFQSLCPPLTPEELSLLDTSINENGCKEAIEVWANHDDTIIDGHNRYRICKSCKIDFKTKALKFETRGEVINYIIAKQLGRRNLTEFQKSALRGRRYANEKEQGKRTDLTSAQNDEKLGNDESPPETTAEKLGKEYGVSRITIQRDEHFAMGLEKIAQAMGEQMKNDILSGVVKIKRGVIEKLRDADAEEVKSVIANATKKKEAKRDSATSNNPLPKPNAVKLLSQKATAIQMAVNQGMKLAEACGIYGLQRNSYSRVSAVVQSNKQILIDAMDSELLTISGAETLINRSVEKITEAIEKAKAEKAAKNHKPLSVAGRSKQELLRELLERTYADWSGASNNRPISKSCIPTNAEKLAELELLCKNVRRYVIDYLKRIEEEISNVRQG